MGDFDEVRLKKYLNRIATANLVEDIKFREVAKSKEAIEEILQVILDDDKLKVVRCIDQRSLTKSIFHGVILDCECILKAGELVNVEMQVDDDDDVILRMRYNQSALTVQNSLKNKDFKYKNLPRIISIMVCDFDPFILGKPIYEVKRVINGNEKIADNGITEIYVNLKAKVEAGKLKELFKIFTNYDYVNESSFPNLTEKKKEINGKLEGVKFMTGISKEIFLDGKAEGKAEGILKAYVDMVKDKIISIADAARRLGMSEDSFAALVK